MPAAAAPTSATDRDRRGSRRMRAVPPIWAATRCGLATVAAAHKWGVGHALIGDRRRLVPLRSHDPQRGGRRRIPAPVAGVGMADDHQPGDCIPARHRLVVPGGPGVGLRRRGRRGDHRSLERPWTLRLGRRHRNHSAHHAVYQHDRHLVHAGGGGRSGRARANAPLLAPRGWCLTAAVFPPLAGQPPSRGRPGAGRPSAVPGGSPSGRRGSRPGWCPWWSGRTA